MVHALAGNEPSESEKLAETKRQLAEVSQQFAETGRRVAKMEAGETTGWGLVELDSYGCWKPVGCRGCIAVRVAMASIPRCRMCAAERSESNDGETNGMPSTPEKELDRKPEKEPEKDHASFGSSFIGIWEETEKELEKSLSEN